MKSTVFIILSLTVLTVAENSWDYNNTSEWPGLCKTGKSQSPVDIRNNGTEKPQLRRFQPFKFSNYDVQNPATIVNDGHSTMITLNSPEKLILSGGGLRGRYVFASLHFHWQSEHTVNGERYPLELQLVHHLERYSSTAEALGKSRGIAVLSVFVKQSEDAENVTPLEEVVEEVSENLVRQMNLEKSVTLMEFLPNDTEHFYRYEGSLTTPACNEGVTWTVFINTLSASLPQLKHFESIWTTDPPTLTYRPLQQLNRRRVVQSRGRNMREKSGSGAPVASVLLTLLLVHVSL